MKQIPLRKAYYHLKHRYFTLNNLVAAIALFIAASWAWGSVELMQRNYGLQKELDAKKRELTLTELEMQTLAYQQRYYQSNEYRDLAAREHLGLVQKGEKVLILPPNSEAAKQYGKSKEVVPNLASVETPSNFEQWMNFLFGGNFKDLQE